MTNFSVQSELQDEIVEAIRKCINRNMQQDEIQALFPNQVLRDDVLELLNRYCTVVYYPLEDENNNGFHITDIPDKNGKLHTFVFINSAQTLEKQIFTAAHELGHIWQVDQYVEQECDLEVGEALRERIINRFAAELMIPQKVFEESYRVEYQKVEMPDKIITLGNMLVVIVNLMNQFLVPEKAIVVRCFELHKISQQTANLILGEGEVRKDIIDKKIGEIIRDNGYIKFQNPTNKKWIARYADLLDKADRSGKISKDKIKKIRTMFSINEEDIQEKLNDPLNVEGPNAS